MMNKRIIVLLTFLIILGLATQISVGGAQEEEKWIIASCTTGGTAYPIGVALGQLVEEKSGWASASTITSACSVENINLLYEGEATMGFVQNNVGVAGLKGENWFEGRPQPDLRVIAPAQLSHYQLLALKDANIKSIQDLKGKRFVLGRIGSGTATSSLAVLASFGMTEDDIKAEWLGQSEAVGALRDRKVDAALMVGAAPIGAITDILLTTRHVELVELPLDEIEKIHEDNPGFIFPLKLPAGMYPGQEEEMMIMGHIQYIMTKEDYLSDDQVYKFLDLVYSNLDWLAESHTVFKSLAYAEPQEYVVGYEVPLHPGAERYYREEKGLK